MKDTELIRVSDRLFIVNSPTSGRFPMAYAFFIMGSDTHALIDPGCGPQACKAIQEEYGVDFVINSHCHPDHVSGNHLFAGKDLWVPEQGRDQVGTVKLLSRRLVGPDQAVMDSWEKFAQEGLDLQDYTPTHTFGDGQAMDFGGITLEAVHTPGHLADHYCFLEPKENILLSFDIDLTGFGPFYGNPEADIPAFRASMDRIQGMQPRVVASSHRMPVREKVDEELEAFQDKIARNADRVASVLDVPRTLEDICARKPIFGKYIPGLEVIYTFFEGWMIRKQLDDMVDQGQVELKDGHYARTDT